MKKLVFSSDDLPGHLDDSARFQLWRDVYTSRFGEAEFYYGGERPFRAHSEFAQVGQLGITRTSLTLQRTVRTSRHVASDAREDLLIGFNLGTRTQCLIQRGREMISPAGAGLAGAYTNSQPLDAYLDGEMALVGVCVPLKVLLPLVPDAENLTAKLVADSPAARHLGHYLNFLLGSQEVQAESQLQSQIESTLIDLVVLALGGDGDSAELATGRGLRAARAREIVAVIAERFVDPSFSPQEVCLKLGLSQRYMQELLQETGLSFTERVLELRLQRARTMLADRRNDRRKIGDIAFASGFSDISYFNQAFRRRFGAVPTHFRGSTNGG